MPKSSVVFVCRECGHEYPRWQGKCDQCELWNTIEEFRLGPRPKASKLSAAALKPVTLSSIGNQTINRIKTNISEIDRVFGGGFVPGSLILLSGEPGIGKSTLLLQIIGRLSQNHPVLYWSAEESVEQIANRAIRLKLNQENLQLISTLDASVLGTNIEAEVVIVDSIQTIMDPNIPASAGSVTQVRSVLQSIQIWAKENNRVVIVVGHVTKEGSLAGPKTLEHLVDVVTVLEGDPNYDIRLLRGTKNRFGPTNEVGVFSMTTEGLEAVDNPSKYFLEEKLPGATGSVVTSTLEGTRPFLIEVQALVTKSYLTFPRRTVSGIDSKRLDLIIAILEQRAGIKLYDQDIFVNIVGGIRIAEPSVDLAVAVSIISALWQRPIPADWCIFGELGLAGEIRGVKAADLRIKEAKRLGFMPLPKLRTIKDVVDRLKNNKTTGAK